MTWVINFRNPGLPNATTSGRRPSTWVLAASILILTAGSLRSLEAQAREQTPSAEVAWEQGNYTLAERLYADRLVADSHDRVALHRMALLLAWGEHHERSLVLFDQLIALEPGNVEAAVDRSRVLAWKNDLPAAMAAINAVIRREPGNLPALQAQAQFAAWAGDHRAALESYERILELSPGDHAVRRQRAQVLSWSDRLGEAAGAFAEVLNDDPNDDDARIGLARTLSWTRQFDSASVVYASILTRDPGHVEALQGFARVASWSGDLRIGEARWRAALAASTEDVISLVGLSQTLRWQGRHAEAVAYAERAVRLAPADGDARTELRWAELPLAPAFWPGYSYEQDSDGNNISTLSLAGSLHLTPRVEVRADGYWRDLAQTGIGGFERHSAGGQLATTWRPDGGWAFSVGAGASRSTLVGAETILRYGASVHMPAHLPLRLSLGMSRRALDGTARLAQNGVAVEELSLDANVSLTRSLTLDTRLSAADFIGAERNRRYFLRSDLAQRLGRDWRVALGATAFSFQKSADDGYFNPDRFALGEVQVRWMREFGPWVLSAEAAPGGQKIGSDGKVQGTFRVGGRLAYNIGQGRQLGIALGHSSHGLESFASRDSEYRYRSLVMSGGWAF